MSDDTSLRYSNSEVFKLVSGNTNNIEPTHPYQVQWMAHWSQASSSTSMQAEHFAGTRAPKCQTGRRCLPVKTMKQSYGYECRNSWRCKKDQISYMHQAIEAQGGDNGRVRIINNSVLKRNLHSSSSETLERLPKPKLTASSENWEKFSSCHFQNSNSLRSERSHFPMLDINRKLETIMALKKRTRSQETKLAPHLTGLAYAGHHHPEQNMAQNDEDIRPYKSLGGLPYYNCHGPNVTSIVENDEENDYFCSGLALKEHFANANLSHLKHELCNCSKQPTIMVSEMQNDDLRCVGSSWNRLQGGSSYCPENVPCPLLLSEECDNERQNSRDSYRTSLEVSRLNKMSCNSLSRKKGDCGKSSSGTQHRLIRKAVSMDLCHKDRIVGDSAASANTKGIAFFEKLTLPAMSYFHGYCKEKPQTLVSPTNNTEYSGGIDTQFMIEKNVPLAKTDAMHIDVQETPSCPEDGSSAQSPESKSRDDDSPSLRSYDLEKEESLLSTPCTEEIPQDVAHPNLKSSDIADTDSSRPKSMDLLSRNPFNAHTESTPDSEPRCRWLKRLRPNPLDPIPLGSKRFKAGDTSTGEMKNLLAKVANYNRSISDLPDYQLDKATFVTKNGEYSPGDSAKVIPWIRRWCKSSQDTALPTQVICEPENSRLPPEKFEAKQFPSLAAMALMGKQVTNFRPCEFRRIESVVVWKI